LFGSRVMKASKFTGSSQSLLSNWTPHRNSHLQQGKKTRAWRKEASVWALSTCFCCDAIDSSLWVFDEPPHYFGFYYRKCPLRTCFISHSLLFPCLSVNVVVQKFWKIKEEEEEEVLFCFLFLFFFLKHNLIYHSWFSLLFPLPFPPSHFPILSVLSQRKKERKKEKRKKRKKERKKQK